MEQSEITARLQMSLEAHQLSCATEREWVLPGGQLPAIRALWHPSDSTGRLDIHVLVEPDLLVEECFAGIGAGDEGFNDAFANFIVNSLHVMMAALWDRNDPDQVMVERWKINGTDFNAYIGNFGRRSSDGVDVSVPRELFPAIEKGLKAQALKPGVHWLRTFVASFKGQLTLECLLDNENLPDGISLLRTIAWPQSDGYYSFRNFIMLRGGVD